MTGGDRKLRGAAVALGVAGAVAGALSEARTPRRRRFPRYTVALAVVIVVIGSVLSVVAWFFLNGSIVVTCQGVAMAPGDRCRYEGIDRFGAHYYVSRDYEEQRAFLYGWRRAGLIAAICLTVAGALLGIVRVGRWLWVSRGDAARGQGGAAAAK